MQKQNALALQEINHKDYKVIQIYLIVDNSNLNRYNFRWHIKVRRVLIRIEELLYITLLFQ